MSERKILVELLAEVREIRKNLDTLKMILRDIQTRIANLETSRIEYPESTRRM